MLTDTTPLYFHGLPGHPDELTALEPSIKIAAHTRMECRGEPLNFDGMATHISKETQGQPLHLIGFSMGAMTALRLAARLPEQTVKVDLISPAAPLNIGDFLSKMAGKPIFQAAAKSQGALDRLVALQKFALRVAPNAFLSMLFNGVCEDEHALLKEPPVRKAIISGLKYSILDNTARYKSELRHYTAAWSTELEQVVAPVQIWQGSEDTWVPPEMAEALASSLPEGKINLLNGLGHYGALIAFITKITTEPPISTAKRRIRAPI
jgi:pimeloyl-ACP methyl ester carboxylesterase